RASNISCERHFSNAENNSMTEYAMNNIDQYGDGYMEQEEEWEREGLLDPAWEKQQKKVCLHLLK
ncbi:hypothetical protein L9F63_020147, partial [Diploptera punctata]